MPPLTLEKLAARLARSATSTATILADLEREGHAMQDDAGRWMLTAATEDAYGSALRDYFDGGEG